MISIKSKVRDQLYAQRMWEKRIGIHYDLLRQIWEKMEEEISIQVDDNIYNRVWLKIYSEMEE